MESQTSDSPKPPGDVLPLRSLVIEPGRISVGHVIRTLEKGVSPRMVGRENSVLLTAYAVFLSVWGEADKDGLEGHGVYLLHERRAGDWLPLVGDMSSAEEVRQYANRVTACSDVQVQVDSASTNVAYVGAILPAAIAETVEIGSAFDLTLGYTSMSPGHVHVFFTFNKELFNDAAVEQCLLPSFTHILEEVLAVLDGSFAPLAFVSTQQANSLEKYGTQTMRLEGNPPSVTSVVDMFVNTCRNDDGTSIAVVDTDGTSHTYAALLHLGLCHAFQLQSRITDIRGVVVGLMLRRSVDVIACILGCWLAGAAYVPIDPSTPVDRVKDMLNAARAKLLVVHKGTIPNDALKSRLTIPFITIKKYGIGRSSGMTAKKASLPGLNGQLRSSSIANVVFTSGSTGTPKGVMIEHRSILNFVLGQLTTLHKPSANHKLIGTQLVGVGFDPLTLELWPVLCTGGTVHVVPDAVKYEATNLGAWMGARAVNFAVIPMALAPLVEPPVCTSQPMTVVTGGSNADANVLRRWVTAGHTIVNQYGPTEATVGCVQEVYYGNQDYRDVVAVIGRPCPNYICVVLQEKSGGYFQAPVGAPGILFVGGVGLAREYINNAGETERRFVNLPPWGRMYNTGDLCRWCPSNNVGGLVLQCLGRVDKQVKVRGHRVELGDIDHALQALDNEILRIKHSVTQCVDGALVSFLVLHSAFCHETIRLVKLTSVQALAVRKHLLSRLPAYMVPKDLWAITEIPMTRNDKVDSRKLLVLRKAALQDQQAHKYSADVGQEDTILGVLMQDVLMRAFEKELGLQAGSCRPKNNFYAIGGDSLTAVSVVKAAKELAQDAAINKYLQRFSVALLMEYPVVLDLSNALLSEAPSEDTMMQSMEEIPEAIPGTTALAFPTQERFWVASLLTQDPHAYDSAYVAEWKGARNAAADQVSATMTKVVAEHDALRTVFKTNKDSLQQVVLPPESCVVQAKDVVRLKVAPSKSGCVFLKDLVKWHEPHDLEQWPLFRFGFVELVKDNSIQCGDGVIYFYLNVHHAIIDGEGLRILLREFNRHLSNVIAVPRVTVPSYLACTAWYYKSIHSSVALKQQEQYWQGVLASGGARMMRFGHKNLETIQADEAHCCIEWRALGHSVSKMVQQVCAEEKVTPHQFFLACYGLLLHCVRAKDGSLPPAEEGVFVGMPASGMRASHSALRGVIGAFINTVLIKVTPGQDQTLKNYLLAVKRTCVEALENGDLPFQNLRNHCVSVPSSGVPGMFNVLFGGVDYQTTRDLPGPGKQFLGEPLDVVGNLHSNVALALFFRSTRHREFHLKLEWARDMISCPTVQTIYFPVLERIVAEVCKVMLQSSKSVSTLDVCAAAGPTQVSGAELPLPSDNLYNLHTVTVRERQKLAASAITKKTYAHVGNILKLVLHVQEVCDGESSSTTFFALGGDSMMLVQLQRDLQTKLGKDVDMADLYEAASMLSFEGLKQFIAEYGEGCDGHDNVDPEADHEGRLGYYERLVQREYIPQVHEMRRAMLLSTATEDEDAGGVLLTGATGFVGMFMLRELLKQHADERLDIYLLVRASSSIHAEQRLIASMEKFGLWDEVMNHAAFASAPLENKHVLHAVVGDAQESCLGLGNEGYASLAASIGRIFHAAADVNFMAPFACLKHSNCDAVIRILEFAAFRRCKRLRPIHYISSIGVATYSFRFHGYTSLMEDYDLQQSNECFALGELGYSKSKWVAERTLQAAKHIFEDDIENSRISLPLFVYRLGFTLTSEKGSFSPLGFVNLWTRVSLAVGKYPDIPDLCEELHTIEAGAEAIVAIAKRMQGEELRDAPDAQYFHIVPEDDKNISTNELFEKFNTISAKGSVAGGVPLLQKVKLREWTDSVEKEVLAKHEFHPWGGLHHLFTDKNSFFKGTAQKGMKLAWIESVTAPIHAYRNFPRVDSSNAKKHLSADQFARIGGGVPDHVLERYIEAVSQTPLDGAYAAIA